MIIQRKRKYKPTGYILYEDSDIVAIVTIPATKPSAHKNDKTGPMLQIWILVKGIDPIQAIRSGRDYLVCGNCKLRGRFGKRACYVRIDLAPLAVWRAYHRGSYPFLHRVDYPSLFVGRSVRFGAYGDPAFLPFGLLSYIAFFAERHTGYTHQWANPEYQHYRSLLMASCDSPDERTRANATGWRAFRIRTIDGSLYDNEIDCPASPESGHLTTCHQCGLCNGSQPTDRRKNISITVHGIGKRNFQPASKLIQIGA